MKIFSGPKGDAAREARDKAENKFYQDAYNYSLGKTRMKEEYQSRRSNATEDVRRQIDRLISDGYAKQIFEDDVDVNVFVGYGNKSYRTEEENTRRGNNPEQVNVEVSNKRYSSKVPFSWEWRARFDYEWGHGNSDGKYVIKNDVSSYSFNSSDPTDIEYFAACADIFKALSKLNWNKILTTNYFAGMEDYIVDPPERDYEGKPDYESRYEREIKEDEIAEALEKWKKGKDWLYVADIKGYTWDWGRGGRGDRKLDSPERDKVSSELLNGPGYYKYLGETDKYYRVAFMNKYEGQKRIKEGGEPEIDKWASRDKVKKDEFERCIYYPITWFGRA